jgi:CBS domain containing-hemolysin-like protein
MFTALIIILVVLFILLVIVASIHPMPSVVSTMELERRSKKASAEAKAQLRREKYLPDVIALQRAVVAVLLVAVVLLSVITFGWVIGVIAAVIVALEYVVFSKWSVIRQIGEKLYRLLEPPLLRFVEKFNAAFIFLRGIPLHDVDAYHRFDSREELQQLIDQSGDILSEDERKLIVHSLQFKDQRVDTVMTPKADIKSIKKSEFLGPLVLSELHDTGHSRLPVISNDINHVVGVLHLTDLLSLDVKRSVTAEKAMEAKVYYIHKEQTLEHALAAFLTTHHHLFIVINDDRETVGLLTLEDVIEALLGRKIFDENDNHEDAKAIAGHRTVLNSPENHVDL